MYRSSSAACSLAGGQGDRPNQDACLRLQGKSGHLVAVSDGLGSRRASARGARAAVEAAAQAVRLWSRADASAGDLTFLIEALWRLLIAPGHGGDCAANVALAFIDRAGRSTALVLGDASVIISHGGGVEILSGKRDGDFANETLALGVPHRLSDWVIWQGNGPLEAIAATDGVTGELLEERLGELPAALCRQIRPLSPQARPGALRRSLRQLRNTDDKTLALIWSELQ